MTVLSVVYTPPNPLHHFILQSLTVSLTPPSLAIFELAFTLSSLPAGGRRRGQKDPEPGCVVGWPDSCAYLGRCLCSLGSGGCSFPGGSLFVPVCLLWAFHSTWGCMCERNLSGNFCVSVTLCGCVCVCVCMRERVTFLGLCGCSLFVMPPLCVRDREGKQSFGCDNGVHGPLPASLLYSPGCVSAPLTRGSAGPVRPRKPEGRCLQWQNPFIY